MGTPAVYNVTSIAFAIPPPAFNIVQFAVPLSPEMPTTYNTMQFSPPTLQQVGGGGGGGGSNNNNNNKRRRNKEEEGSFVVPHKSSSNSLEDVVCIPKGSADRIYTFGAFTGEDPFSFPFTTLLLQLCLIMFTTRLLHFLLRPLNQPRIVCDILGGVLLGPHVLGKVTGSSRYGIVYKETDSVVLRVMATTGLLFYLFMNGVKTEPKMLVQSGKKALVIGITSMLLPFLFLSSAAYYFRDLLFFRMAKGKFLIFIPASLSITAFPVLAEILAELNLLNSELGRLAMSSSMVHGLFGWFFMSLFTIVNQSQRGAKLAVWSVLALIAMAVFVVFVFRPWMQWIIKKTPKGGRVSPFHVNCVMVSVIVMACVSDGIGASYIDGPLLMGLAVPEGPPLGTALERRTSLFGSEVMMRALFFLSGTYIVPQTFKSWRRWIVMLGVILLGLLTKVVGTMVPAVLVSKIPTRNAFLLGLIMNFKGLLELITYLYFLNGSLLGKESYTMLVLCSVLVTAITAPMVSMLYNPFTHNSLLGRRAMQHLKPTMELRTLMCVHTEEPVPTMINLLEACAGSAEVPTVAYVLHLVDLAGRSSSALIAHKNSKGYLNLAEMDVLLNAFLNYEQQKKGSVIVQPYTALTPLKSMHQDIYSLAAHKNVYFVVVPFPRKQVMGGTAEIDQAIRANVATILEQATCSIGLLVYKDHGAGPVCATPGQFRCHIGVLFWGGADDREALAFASRAARNPGVSITIIRFIVASIANSARDARDQQADDELMSTIKMDNMRNEFFTLNEAVVDNLEQSISMLRSTKSKFDLLIVGRRQDANSAMEQEMAGWSECPELGVVGDMLSSSDFDCSFSLLVIQQ